jgi:hypothetical protein
MQNHSSRHKHDKVLKQKEDTFVLKFYLQQSHFNYKTAKFIVHRYSYVHTCYISVVKLIVIIVSAFELENHSCYTLASLFFIHWHQEEYHRNGIMLLQPPLHKLNKILLILIRLNLLIPKIG